MSAQTLSRAEVTVPTDGDLNHTWCCDENVAMCGLDISGHPVVAAGAEPRCPMCAYMDAEGLPCPVPGCEGGDS